MCIAEKLNWKAEHPNRKFSVELFCWLDVCVDKPLKISVPVDCAEYFVLEFPDYLPPHTHTRTDPLNHHPLSRLTSLPALLEKMPEGLASDWQSPSWLLSVSLQEMMVCRCGRLCETAMFTPSLVHSRTKGIS